MGGSALLDAAKNLHDADPRRGGEAVRLRAVARSRSARTRSSGRAAHRSRFADFAGLTAEGIFLNKKHTYTYGAHAAHVTVDARIGRSRSSTTSTVVDCGRIINPMTVRGQVIGSLVQGLGGAMLEDLRL